MPFVSEMNMRIKINLKKFTNQRPAYTKKGRDFHRDLMKWALRDSNPRPSACKADALNQLS